MLDSGTPFFIIKEIAWTAELPEDEDILKLIRKPTNYMSILNLSNYANCRIT